MITKIVINIITVVFKVLFLGLGTAKNWLKNKRNKYDPFNAATKRYLNKLKERYGEVRIFGTTGSIPLKSIYTRINILTKITARQRLSIDELEKSFNRDKRSFGIIRESISGTEAANLLQKFILLGKPGSGKTTYLKYIALQAADGSLNEKKIPVFISLKDFSESSKSIIDFMIEQFDICDFPESEPFIERKLKKGKCLLLFDGLDEVCNEKMDNLIRQLRDFSDKYSYNQFIISCRIAAYNYCFEKFKDVEIADFNDMQIQTFINNWFSKETKMAELCWVELNKNNQIRGLASTPLLLALKCLVFEELKTFHKNKIIIYKEGIDILLKKWDTSKGIKRDRVYRYLSVRHKESMFCRIAAHTFEKNQYFFSQQKLESYIVDFFQNVQEVEEEMFEIDSEAILKSIETQHGFFVERAKGIYSFSHLTFQEYFAAKFIVDNASERTLELLVKYHLYDSNWREIFLLTTQALEEADDFFHLMKVQIDSFLIEIKNKELADFLRVIQKDIIKKDLPYLSFECRGLAIFYVICNVINQNYDVSDSSDPFDIYSNVSARARGGGCGHGYQSSDSTYISYSHMLDLILSLTCAFDNKRTNNFDHILSIERANSININIDQLESSFIIYLTANILLLDCIKIGSHTPETEDKILNDILAVPQ